MYSKWRGLCGILSLGWIPDSAWLRRQRKQLRARRECVTGPGELYRDRGSNSHCFQHSLRH